MRRQASASARIAQLESLLPSTPAQMARGQTHFAVAAWQELLENRRVIQWSYAFGYCHDKSRTNERELLEFCQGVRSCTMSIHDWLGIPE